MNTLQQIYDQFIAWHFFIAGATCMLNLVASLLFVRCYRRTHDRLFLYFAAAFAILAGNRAFLGMANESFEPHTQVYFVRLLAFLAILYAIIDKNRAHKGPRLGP